MDCGILVWTVVVLLRSLSDKYAWASHVSPNPPRYGLDSIKTVLLER